jgi:predicted nucleic acid-binding protein
MRSPTIFVETTIPSAYLEERLHPEMVARRLWTRRWWDRALMSSRLVTSPEVLLEVSRGDVSRAAARLSLMSGLEVLPVDAQVLEIAQVYVARKVMPQNPVSDAVHLAVASYYRCDFLVTWNYTHLVNANKFAHIRSVNESLGLFVPELVTPIQLLGGSDADELTDR